jgi:hypothetical protein
MARAFSIEVISLIGLLCRLIVVACLVEMGEVVARLVVHATSKGSEARAIASAAAVPMDRDSILRVLEGMALTPSST